MFTGKYVIYTLYTENVKMFVLDFSNIQYGLKFLFYLKLSIAEKGELHRHWYQANSVVSHCPGKTD